MIGKNFTAKPLEQVPIDQCRPQKIGKYCFFFLCLQRSVNIYDIVNLCVHITRYRKFIFIPYTEHVYVTVLYRRYCGAKMFCLYVYSRQKSSDIQIQLRHFIYFVFQFNSRSVRRGLSLNGVFVRLLVKRCNGTMMSFFCNF